MSDDLGGMKTRSFLEQTDAGLRDRQPKAIRDARTILEYVAKHGNPRMLRALLRTGRRLWQKWEADNNEEPK